MGWGNSFGKVLSEKPVASRSNASRMKQMKSMQDVMALQDIFRVFVDCIL